MKFKEHCNRTLNGGGSVEGRGRVLAEGRGKDKLYVRGEDDVPVVLVAEEAQAVDHVHHPDYGLKRLRRNLSCREKEYVRGSLDKQMRQQLLIRRQTLKSH